MESIAKLKIVPAVPLTVFSWGTGITDLRGFNIQVFSPEHPPDFGTAGYDKATALQAIELSVAKAEPGMILASNPHYGNYAKWNCLLKEFGFAQIGTCAVNRVYQNQGWTWKKTGMHYEHPAELYKKTPWESKDGWRHWIHAYFLIKPGAKKLAFDWSKRRKSPGDNYEAFWQVSYMNNLPKDPSSQEWEHNYARLSQNCGIGFGEGLPKLKRGYERFFTIAAIKDGEKFPKPWKCFAEVGGLRFGHNHGLLDSAMPECIHDHGAF